MAILAFLESPIGKLLAQIISVFILIGVLVGGYFIWKNHIQNEAMAKFNQQQMEQAAKDKADFDNKLKQIDAAQAQILTKLNQQNEDSKAVLDSVQDYIDDQATTDQQSSAVLKETIRRLAGEKK